MSKRIIAICAVLLIMLGAVSCIREKAPEIPGSSEKEESASVSESESETPEPPVVFEEIKPREGYSSVSQIVLDLNITDNGTKLNRKARVALLKDENGNGGLYMDVLNVDGTIKCSKQWDGFGQIFFDPANADNFIVFRVNAQENGRGQIACEYYTVTDIKYTMGVGTYTEEQLDSVQILNDPRLDNAGFYFNMTDPQSLLRYTMNFINFFDQFEEILYKTTKNGQEYYLLADNFLNQNEGSLFEPKDKEPLPDFISMREKYTPEYLVEIFS